MDEEIDWGAESLAVINDVKAHVKNIFLSTTLAAACGVYLNVTTIEDQVFCVLMSPSGFQVVGLNHDNKDLEDSNEEFYETPYAFLNKVSPSYSQSFGNLLLQRLNEEFLKQNNS